MPTVAHTLVIRHVPNTNPPQFTVERLGDGRTAPAVAVAPPNSVPVEGRPTAKLTAEIRWYLERFLEYPFPPETEYAERVQAAVETWGRQTFTALFAHPHARRSYEKAVENGFENLTLRIVSDSPIILGWPWEALHDPEVGYLAQQCEVERRIDAGRDPLPLKGLPTDRVNVLLVIARPLEGDVRYRSVSRSLVELAADHTFPIAVHVLRPPTFDQLCEHLRRHPNHYHILHFDGHGAYRTDAPVPGGGNVLLRAADARLLFEKEDGSKDPIEASVLSELLREHAVPAVVLNACQSAMIDEKAADPFASVAAALLKAGTRSVVAMAYALYVSGAQQFLPAFYRRLFETGNLAGAVRAGRQQMLRNRERVCARGTHPLDDWVVPVVYQQDPLDFSFVTRTGGATAAPADSRLPAEARDDRNPYGFIGRDGAILALERALHRPPAGIVITGLGGVGKTTLARGFLKWLEQTNGLGAGALWFDFRDVRSAEYVLNRLGEALTGKPEFATLGVAQKLDLLAGACKKTPVRIVWDNFESARGIAGTPVAANLSEADAGVLKEFLTRLRGGQTKVIITSRSPEDWLGPTNAGAPISLGGLDGEERWEFANTIVRDLGLTLDRKDPAISDLMKLLRGHPLAMRVMLSKLATHSAAHLIASLGANTAQQHPAAQDDPEAMLFATLRFATDALPAAWDPILVSLGLHKGYADVRNLGVISRRPRAEIDECMAALVTAGLVRNLAQAVVFELHPLLTSHLKGALDLVNPDTWGDLTRAFVNVMSFESGSIVARPPKEQQAHFRLYEGSFHAAREAAERLGMRGQYADLTNHLADAYSDIHNYSTATALCDQLQSHHVQTGDLGGQAFVYHKQGDIALKRQDLGRAEECFHKSLEIKERLADKDGAAITYHALGVVANGRRNFDQAEAWLHKSLEIKNQTGRDQIEKIYQQLGQIALERKDFDAASQWGRKSQEVSELKGDERGAAVAHYNLGVAAEMRRDFEQAEKWYHKSLVILARVGGDGLENVYHQLGRVAEERRDLDRAEEWYLKSLIIEERQGNDYGASYTYHQMGAVALLRGDFVSAWSWFLKAMSVFVRFQDQHHIDIAVRNLTRSFGWAPPDVRPRLFAAGREAGLPDELLRQIEASANEPPAES